LIRSGLKISLKTSGNAISPLEFPDKSIIFAVVIHITPAVFEC